jgi:hypothetical protein
MDSSVVQMEPVHKKIEPYLEIIIGHNHFKKSIWFWQTYYCGMNSAN